MRKWTEFQLNNLDKVQAILEELEEFQPLTLRQIYYQMVSKGYIENNISQYTSLCTLLTDARYAGRIPWDAMEDRTRSYHDLTGWLDAEQFKTATYQRLLRGYRRDLMQSQDCYIEIWVEKDAMSSIFIKVAEPYTIPVVVNKGFHSTSFLYNYSQRLQNHDNKRPVILYFGDFDPSGKDMPRAIEKRLKNDLDVHTLSLKTIALSLQDIETYRLPYKPEAVKKLDKRTPKFVAEYGKIAVELDALPLVVMKQKIKDSILNEIYVDDFNEQVEKEQQELIILNSLRDTIKDQLITKMKRKK